MELLVLNTAAFVEAPFRRFGTSPRTEAIRLPGLINVDFPVRKMFQKSGAIQPTAR